jgi:NAD(P)-dependent dehydrogenase (short-subunit alcohol dehydrogenase family)
MGESGVKDVEGKVAVITGGGQGIGRALAEKFTAEGMKVVIADVVPELVEQTTKELRDEGREVTGVVTDVTSLESVEALRDATLETYGAVHVVCNNAGIIRRGVKSWELPLEDWETVLRVNLFGVVHGMLTFVPILLASGEEGHIVNTASMAAVLAVPGIGPYTASKHAVLGISEAMHTELRSIGAPIGISVLMPGLVRTRIGSPPSTPDPEGPLDPGQMDPREVGSHVVRGIKEDRLHVFTHPELLDSVRQRFGRITDG